VCEIQFSESFTYKNGLSENGEKKTHESINFRLIFQDFTISPSVWIGTSTGSVLVVNLNIIYEPRNISGKNWLNWRIVFRIISIDFSCTKWNTISIEWKNSTHSFSRSKSHDYTITEWKMGYKKSRYSLKISMHNF